MTSMAARDHLLDFSSGQHEELRLRDAAGKQIAKGVKFAHELIQKTPLLDDTDKYLELLQELLAREQRRIRGSGDDDPDGRVLGGMEIVMNEVEVQRRRLRGTPGQQA
jgi:hypothetical protein